MNIHNDINKDIRFLAKSEIRLKILNELQKRPNSIRGLVKKTQITYSSVSSNIMKLEKNNYITKSKHNYQLNPMTEMYLTTFMDFKNSADLINDYDDFWNWHNIEQLSIESIKNMTDLKDSELIETTPIDIFKTHNTVKNQLVKSKTVRAVFPYLHPQYPKIIKRIVENGGSIEMILPENVYGEMMKRLNKQTVENERIKIYRSKKAVNLFLTINDSSMILGLFKNDGSFDQNRILTSENCRSIRWAEKLYSHIENQVIQ